MKNRQVLAVALAALLTGGVAVAAYQNNRADQPAPIMAGSAPVLANGDSLQADLAPSTAIPSAGRVEYASVVAVTPITSSSPRYATVIGMAPVQESTTTSAPRQVCDNVVVQERLPERDGNVGGTVAGAVIGGLVGNQVGGGRGRDLATVGGAVAGGMIGNRIDRNHVGGRVVNRTEQRCHTVSDSRTSSKTVAWDVTYREPDGRTATLRTQKKPGERIAVGEAPRTLGYDVTYRYAGSERTIRMDQRPGTRLPVIDGQVVTQTASAGSAHR